VEEKIEINKNILMRLRIRLRCQCGGVVDSVNSAIECDTLLLKVKKKLICEVKYKFLDIFKNY